MSTDSHIESHPRVVGEEAGPVGGGEVERVPPPVMGLAPSWSPLAPPLVRTQRSGHLAFGICVHHLLVISCQSLWPVSPFTQVLTWVGHRCLTHPLTGLGAASFGTAKWVFLTGSDSGTSLPSVSRNDLELTSRG